MLIAQDTESMADSDFASENELEETLRGQYRELAELAGSLAHEIKNPLSVIRMNVELLAEDLRDTATPQARRTLQKIDTVHNQCIRLENLLNDFLKFARLGQLDLRAGSLNEQIARVLDLFQPQADECEIEIIRYLDPDLPSVRLNSETLHAALFNLVKNALEAMPEGGELMVRTHATRTGVALDLIDTGPGMDEKTATKMFNPFFTTKDGGSGLGLPMASKIIEAHGARIDVQSQVGRGTQFTIEFPTPRRIMAEA